jgi:hypothetical protein
MDKLQTEIARAAQLIKDADGLFITAGAGMGVDSNTAYCGLNAAVRSSICSPNTGHSTRSTGPPPAEIEM